jgi:hypothetical protein
MNRKLLYWIDDNNDRGARRLSEANKGLINRELKVEVVTPPINTHADFEEVIRKMKVSDTYGVLMDYQLTGTSESGRMEYGTVWASKLRATKPAIPVIGISAAPESSIPRMQAESFLAFFMRKSLLGKAPPMKEIKALFEGYGTLFAIWKSRSKADGLNIIVPKLDAPEEVDALLRLAVPADLRGKWDQESPHAAARWIWHQLQGVQGFLVDPLEAATALGITEEAFLSRQNNKHILSARYRGLLSCDDRPRWWACSLRPAVEKIVGEPVDGPIGYARSRLLSKLGVPTDAQAAMFAHPYARKKSEVPPDCVTFIDQASKNENRLEDREPALSEDTVVDEVDANPPLGFLPRRRFKQVADHAK